jgi:S1-C subfamily serine protease
VYVSEIVADSPAYNHEIRVGDIIVAFNGKPVSSVDDLHKLLHEKEIGRSASLEVLRGGRKTGIRAVPADANIGE